MKKTKPSQKNVGRVSYGHSERSVVSNASQQDEAVDALLARGIALFDDGNYSELETLSLKWVEDFPAQSAKGWDLLGLALLKLHRIEEAETALLTGLMVDARHLDLWDRLGIVRNRMKKYSEAHDAYLSALVIDPKNPHLLSNAATNLIDAGRYDEALVFANRSLKINPIGHAASLAQGNALMGLGQVDECISAYRRVTILSPEWADGWNNLGGALEKRGLTDEAVAAFQRALQISPDKAEAWNNLGGIFRQKKHDQQALDCFNRAIDINPDLVDPYINMGSLLHGVGRPLLAIEYYEHALRRDPTDPMVYMGLGGCYQDLNRFDDAVVAYCTALELKPNFELAFGNLLFVLNYHPVLSADEIFKMYRDYESINALAVPGAWQHHENDRSSNRRLRVGYVSPDFCAHPVQNFLVPLLASHDAEKFEIFAYSDLQIADVVTAEYKSYVDNWRSVNSLNYHELAALVREDRIDVLVDLAGHTAKNRLKTFSLKPAPVQLTWLGYGSTTGITAIDYFLGDEALIPFGSECLMSEVPWRLANAAFVYRPPNGFPQAGPSPAAKKGYVTFGSLSRSIRLNDALLDVWAELLRQVPNSRLIINSRDFRSPEMYDWMSHRFACRGIDLSRVDIGYLSPAWMPMANIDIMLDCFPHNSGTTLIESLYYGLPMVTLAHRPTVGRLGASLLTALGRTEWIASDPESYLRIAMDLAADIPALALIRAGLQDEVKNSPLMDERGFASSVEEAYREMWRNYCSRVLS